MKVIKPWDRPESYFPKLARSWGRGWHKPNLKGLFWTLKIVVSFHFAECYLVCQIERSIGKTVLYYDRGSEQFRGAKTYQNIPNKRCGTETVSLKHVCLKMTSGNIII